MDIKGKLLVVDDEVEVLNSLKRVFHKEYEVYIAAGAAEAFNILEKSDIEVILCDQRMPNMKGTEFLTKVKDIYPDIIRILITGYSALYDVMIATNESNVFMYLTKPWNVVDLKHSLKEAFDKNSLIRENKKLIDELKNANIYLEEKIKERTREVEMTNEKLKLLNIQLQELAKKDTLTGLNNRRDLSNKFREEQLRAARLNSPLTLMLIDMNNFKAVNDMFGHVAGDFLLIKFAEVATTLIREGLDFIFRIGGDEFLLIMTGCDETSALEVGARLDMELQNHTEIVSLAYGVIEIDHKSNTAFEEYVKIADDRMFEHKRNFKKLQR